MNNFQKMLTNALATDSKSIELISTGKNKLKAIYCGQVYEDYFLLPREARFSIVKAMSCFIAEYDQLRKSCSPDEAELRLAWCIFGSCDSSPDILEGRASFEISSHCTKCQYDKPFCNRVLPNLTAREQECFILMREGLTDKEVADRLGISWSTVTKHMNNAVNRFRDITDSNVTRQYIISQLQEAGV